MSSLRVLVQCRFKLDLGSPKERGRLLALYGRSFSSVMTSCLSKNHKAVEYSYLSKIRSMVSTKDVEDLVSVMIDGDMSQENIKKIVDIMPLFIRLPTDLKAFILMSNGLVPSY